ncbi:high mobility group B protein 7-like [Amaranthus tricolor]|uniref:high mobility group B protein 7-like n=1 Tax=Amaranthus tricolor TaxID=29722 RepID=UPI002585A9C4|nr:high mobility group B protein 7-like [Amaranthus tricolor]
MASTSSNPAKQRKRVEADTPAILKRAKDGSAFARCEECNSSVPVALIDMHNCSAEAKRKMDLESRVVVKPAEIKKKPAERKKSSSATQSGDESKPKKRKLSKAKDPNMPKRPMSGYFVFLEDFRKEYKEIHPDSKGVKEVAKEAGAKWKAMTDEEKKPYLDKAAELKVEYEKAMEAYNADIVDNDEDSGDHQAEELCDDDA